MATIKSDAPHEGDVLHDSNSPSATWGIGGDRVTTVTRHYPPEIREDLRWFFFWARDNGISLSEAAARVGVDSSTIHRVYHGTYRSNDGKLIVPGKLVKGIKSFRREEDRREKLERKRARLTEVPFVLTPTALRIFTLCDLCLTSNRIGFLFGESQTGKTTALEEYQAIHDHGATKFIRIQPGSGTHELIRQFAIECGISPKGAHDSMKRRVIKALDRNHLVIIDEIHELVFTYRTRSKLGCIELIRWIHDMTRCGMVICGTNVWRDDLQEGKDKRLLQQMERRGIFRLQLPPWPSDADLRAIFKECGLGWPDGHTLDVVRGVNQKRGLTALTELLRFGRKLAGDAGQRFAWSHFIEAYEIITDLEKGG